eukprot:4590578-Pleurochrysis_carterae.AAC.1
MAALALAPDLNGFVDSTKDTVLATAGFRGDITTLQKLLRAKLTEYEQQHGEPMKVHAVAQMLANTLYGRRFFPYYTWNVLAGLDENGAYLPGLRLSRLHPGNYLLNLKLPDVRIL